MYVIWTFKCMQCYWCCCCCCSKYVNWLREWTIILQTFKLFQLTSARTLAETTDFMLNRSSHIEFDALNRLSYQFFITYNLHKSYLLCQLGRGLSASWIGAWNLMQIYAVVSGMHSGLSSIFLLLSFFAVALSHSLFLSLYRWFLIYSSTHWWEHTKKAFFLCVYPRCIQTD